MQTAQISNTNGHTIYKKVSPVLPEKDFTGAVSFAEIIMDPKDKTMDISDLAKASLIDLHERLQPPPVAMQIVSDGNPITLFTKGNFSIITGAAKSRKTFLVSQLMAAAIKGSCQDKFVCNESGVNILFDTEQSRYKAQQIAKRICNLAEDTDTSKFIVHSLRTLDPSQRLNLIEYVLESTPNLNFVAIDGIIDLEIDPILQADQAQRIVSKLMKWTEIYNIHIACVLHFNKTVSTLLGHLGSFSHRKADAIISVTKSKEDPNVSIVEALDCREKEFQPFAFSVDAHGLPYILNDFTFEKRTREAKAVEKKPKAITPNSVDADAHSTILINAFTSNTQPGYQDLWRLLKNAIETVTGESIGDNKAKDFATYYQTNRMILRHGIAGKKAIYMLPGQQQLNI